MFLPLKDWDKSGIVIKIPDERTDVVTEALSRSTERVALDLHVGERFQRDHKWIGMPDELVLRPNECIRLTVKEWISTPMGVFGQVCSRASLTAQGLIVSNIKVDPNFSGQLEVAVFNAGKQPIKLERGMAFASVWLGRLSRPLDRAEAPPRSPTQTGAVAFSNTKERLRRSVPFVATAIASIGGSVVAGLLFEVF